MKRNKLYNLLSFNEENKNEPAYYKVSTKTNKSKELFKNASQRSFSAFSETNNSSRSRGFYTSSANIFKSKENICDRTPTTAKSNNSQYMKYGLKHEDSKDILCNSPSYFKQSLIETEQLKFTLGKKNIK
jgi:hypothetical protein